MPLDLSPESSADGLLLALAAALLFAAGMATRYFWQYRIFPPLRLAGKMLLAGVVFAALAAAGDPVARALGTERVYGWIAGVAAGMLLVAVSDRALNRLFGVRGHVLFTRLTGPPPRD